jgi:ABC-2 type transport system permease protein
MIDLFPNAWHIARREYVTRVRTRTFLIITILLALVGIGLAMLPIVGRLIVGDATTTIAIHSPDAELESSTAVSLANLLNASGDAQYRIEAADDVAAAEAEARSGTIDGLLTVTRGADGELSFDALTDARPTDQRLFALRQAATQVNIGDRLQRAGVDPSQVGQIFAPTPFEVTPLDPNAQNPEDNLGPDYVLAMAMVILTFMAVITYGQWVATSVAEEKSSRVMELLVTAATPRQLLAGKVIGTGAAGLTQYLVVVAAAIAGLLLQGTVARLILGDGGGASLEGLNLWVLAPFSAFFVTGFALYSLLYAGLGSIASRQEDVQQVVGPMIVVGMVGYFAAFTAVNVPDAGWVQWLSLVPFFSPYMLPMRLLLSTVAPWEWAAAGALMVAFLAVALWAAARLYSAGVLLYGQRVGLRAVWRATRVHR